MKAGSCTKVTDRLLEPTKDDMMSRLSVFKVLICGEIPEGTGAGGAADAKAYY